MSRENWSEVDYLLYPHERRRPLAVRLDWSSFLVGLLIGAALVGVAVLS